MGGAGVVELFMRRRAALSASLLDLPPVREGLQYFWSGLDLKYITAKSGADVYSPYKARVKRKRDSHV